jgi:hypothetical protein
VRGEERREERRGEWCDVLLPGFLFFADTAGENTRTQEGEHHTTHLSSPLSSPLLSPLTSHLPRLTSHLTPPTSYL